MAELKLSYFLSLRYNPDLLKTSWIIEQIVYVRDDACRTLLLMMSSQRNLRTFTVLLGIMAALSLILNIQITWVRRSLMAQGYYDFVIYYTGAEIVNAGRGKDLYDLSVQQAYQERFKFPDQPWLVLPFNHAPYELIPFLPLAKLSFRTAHLIWSVLSIFLLLIAGSILLSYTDRQHWLLYGVLLLSFYPTLATIKMGQDSAMSLLICVGVFAALKQRRDLSAGGILALGLYKPQLVLPLTGFFFVTRNWQALVGFVATGACLLGISLAIVGWQGVLGLLSIISDMNRSSSIVYPQMMANLRGLFFPQLTFLKSVELSNVFIAAASLLVYGYCLILWKNNKRANSQLFDLQISLAIVATVLISYHLYTHDLIILTIPLILIANYVFGHRPPLSSACKLFLSVLVVLYLPLAPFLLEVGGAFGSLVAPILIIYGFLVFQINSLKRNPQPSLAESRILRSPAIPPQAQV